MMLFRGWWDGSPVRGLFVELISLSFDIRVPEPGNDCDLLERDQWNGDCEWGEGTIEEAGKVKGNTGNPLEFGGTHIDARFCSHFTTRFVSRNLKYLGESPHMIFQFSICSLHLLYNLALFFVLHTHLGSQRHQAKALSKPLSQPMITGILIAYLHIALVRSLV